MLIILKPIPTRPGRELFDSVIIIPQILETFGKLDEVWEG